MNEHHLKIDINHYKNIKAGTKTFEIRDNSDRGFQKGDTVELRAFDRSDGQYYTLSSIKKKIGDVYPIDATRVVFSLLEIE